MMSKEDTLFHKLKQLELLPNGHYRLYVSAKDGSWKYSLMFASYEAAYQYFEHLLIEKREMLHSLVSSIHASPSFNLEHVMVPKQQA